MSEFTYFPDPQLDRMANLVWQLAQELSVTRARLLATEELLVAAGVLPEGAVADYRPAEKAAERLAADRNAMVDRLMRVLTEDDEHAVPLRAQFTEQLAALGVRPQQAAEPLR